MSASGEPDLRKTEPEEAGLEDLLRQVGPRADPPLEMMRDVHAAVRAEWQATVHERRRRRRWMAWGMAATVLVAVSSAILILGSQFMEGEPTSVATIMRIDGHLLGAGSDDAGRPRTVGQRIVAGETVQADDRSRAVVFLDTGISLRLDHNTILKVISKDRITLASGALYVDSPPELARGSAFEVQAHAGSVRHIGTQYEVRTRAEALEVSVREGRVVIANGANESTAQAGERIRLTPAGEITRTALPPWHPDWQWVAAVAPAFDIDNRPLASFLTWVARETGRRVVYASPQAEEAARKVRLRGSIAGLDPDAALVAVLATTELQRFEIRDGFIGIRFAAETETPSAGDQNP